MTEPSEENTLFELLTHEERRLIDYHDYEREVLLGVDRSKSREEQTHPKVEVIGVLDYLMDHNVIDGDRHEVLCGEVDALYT